MAVQPQPASPRTASALRFAVLGLQVDALDLASTADRIERWIAGGLRSYVCHANVHGVMEAHRDPAVRAAYANAGLIVPDGMPLVWLGRLAGRAVGRVYGPDLVLELCARAARTGASCFYLGGAPGVADSLAATLAERFPGLRTAGTWSPPFGGDPRVPDPEAVRRVNEAKPDIVWIGLGCPRQELWMATHQPLLEASVLIGVGAAFDFHTGRVKQAPRFMQRAGLEWLFRLLAEPRRLWHRYLVFNSWFVLLLLAERVGLRRAQPAAEAALRPGNASHRTANTAVPDASNDADHPGGR